MTFSSVYLLFLMVVLVLCFFSSIIYLISTKSVNSALVFTAILVAGGFVFDFLLLAGSNDLPVVASIEMESFKWLPSSDDPFHVVVDADGRFLSSSLWNMGHNENLFADVVNVSRGEVFNLELITNEVVLKHLL